MTLDAATAATAMISVNAEIIKARVYGPEGAGPSNIASLPEEMNGAFTAAGALVPPYDPGTLALLFENSAALRPNIDALVTNIESFGFRLEPTVNLEASDVRHRIADSLTLEKIADGQPSAITDAEIDARLAEIARKARVEKLHIELFFRYCSVDGSFVDLRERARSDLEITGNAYWEVVRNGLNEVTQLNYVPAISMRLMPEDKQPLRVVVDQKVSAVSYRKTTVRRRFRPFVQIVLGVNQSYFKTFGDPRVMSGTTGRYFDDLDALLRAEGANAVEATEILHFRVSSARSSYGVPRWIGCLLAVLGSRASEEVNYLYFDNKTVPPYAILVSGGTLAEGCVDKLRAYIENEIKGRANFHNLIIIEAEASAQSTATSRVRIELKPLTGAQNDGLFMEYKAACDESVGQSFRLPKIIRGNSGEINRACYSADTETLTEDGWKLHHEIEPTECIAVYDPTTETMRFEVPAAKHVFDVTEELLRFHGQHTDVLVTADHKMLTCSAGRAWQQETAAETARRGRFLLLCAPPNDEAGIELTKFVVPKLCGTEYKNGHTHKALRADDWLEFLGYYLSDGGLLETESKGASRYVAIRQKKPETLALMRACLERLGWVYYEQVKPCGTHILGLSNRCLRAWLLEHCGGRSVCRHPPRHYVAGLPRRQLQIMWDAMKRGDGGAGRTDQNGCFYTKSQSMVDAAQAICVRLGLRSHYRWSNTARVFRLHWAKRTTTEMRGDEHVERVQYKGEVYCFSCPGAGFFVTRRNGKVAIQGNTAEAALLYVEMQVFQPERARIDHVINSRLFAAMGIRFWDFVSNSPNARDPAILVEMVSKLVAADAMTINEARLIMGDIFNSTYSAFAQYWARQPMSLTLAAFQSQGRIQPNMVDPPPPIEVPDAALPIPMPAAAMPLVPVGGANLERLNAAMADLRAAMDADGATSDPDLTGMLATLDQLTAGAKSLRAGDPPGAAAARVDEDGALRIVLPADDFAKLVRPSPEPVT